MVHEGNIAAALRPLLGSLRRGGGGNSRESCVYCFGPPCPPSGVRPAKEMGPEAPQTSFLVWFPEGNPGKGELFQLARLSWGSGGPCRGMGHRGGAQKVAKTRGNMVKTFFLVERSRSVPPTPGTSRAEREGRFRVHAKIGTLFTLQGYPQLAPGPGRRES